MNDATAGTRCNRCGRTLRNTTPDGFGPKCRTRIRASLAAMDAVKPHQIDSAREALEDGAVIPLRASVFLVVSSDGAEAYRTAPQACSCAAGLIGRMCWHRVAVNAVTTGPRARVRAAADLMLAA